MLKSGLVKGYINLDTIRNEEVRSDDTVFLGFGAV
jgi:hypothetical protein